MEIKDVKNSAVFYSRDRGCAAVPGGLVELSTAHYRWLISELEGAQTRHKVLIVDLAEARVERDKMRRKHNSAFQRIEFTESAFDTLRALIENADTVHGEVVPGVVKYGTYSEDEPAVYIPPEKLPNIPTLEADLEAALEEIKRLENEVESESGQTFYTNGNRWEVRKRKRHA